MSIKTKFIAALVGVSAVAGIAGSASAEGRWGYEHPRQHEVLARVHREERAVRTDYRDGLMSRREAVRLIGDDRRIAREDHYFARTNGGYITRGEQRFMNRQENGVARQAY
jgi:hypothetical protein